MGLKPFVNLIKKSLILAIFFATVLWIIILFIKGIQKNDKTKINSEQNAIEEEQQIKIKEAAPEKIISPESSAIRCEYKDKIFKKIDKPDKNDKIQKVIGYQNNKVGIYIYAEIGEFLELADELVNSNGGDWGYVLIPYNVKETNDGRWNKLFAKLREKHLIPIIQLWDLDLGDENKMNDQIKDSAKFLNALDWPIENRYITVYNEVNDKKFWGGKLNPEEYAKVLDKTIFELKKLDENFFVMNGAFNASARSNWEYMDEAVFLEKMNQEVPGIFRKLDGWATHPYPQPNFTGSPQGTGRNSIRAYEWELSLLKKYGVDVDNLPIFITETGWPHKEGDNENNSYFNQYQVADNIRYAFENVWLKDDRIVAITPFTIRYDPPHDNWSWITKNNNPYPQFTSIKDMEKTKGNPPTVEYYTSKVWVCSE